MSFQLILSPVAMADQATTGTDAYVATGNASNITLESQFVKSLIMTGSGVVGSALVSCKSTIANGSRVTVDGLAATAAAATAATAFGAAGIAHGAAATVASLPVPSAGSVNGAIIAAGAAATVVLIGEAVVLAGEGIAADAAQAVAAKPAIVAATDPLAPPSTTPAGRTPNTYKTNSHYIFAGGALVLLLAELAAAIKQKDNLAESNKQADRMTVVANTPTADLTDEQKNVQLTALRLAKTEEENQRDALEARVNWMGAVEVVYWLAVAAASTEAILYASTKALMKASLAAQATETALLTTTTGLLTTATGLLVTEGSLYKAMLLACVPPVAVATCTPATPGGFMMQLCKLKMQLTKQKKHLVIIAGV